MPVKFDSKYNYVHTKKYITNIVCQIAAILSTHVVEKTYIISDFAQFSFIATVSSSVGDVIQIWDKCSRAL